MTPSLKQFSVTCETTIRATLDCININAKGLALVLDEDERLLGTITDGDVRRAVLAGTSLESPLRKLLDERALTPYPQPITAPVGTSIPDLLHVMNERGVRHIPLLDPDGRVVDVALIQDLMKECEVPLRAVVMAGGFGSRLMPLTNEVPKPMLPVGDTPLLELIVKQLQQSGIHRVNLATHYKPEVIREHFGDGQDFGLAIEYVNEDQPLGTAGALSLMKEKGEPLLVINGDILTEVDFRAMLAYHREHKAEITVAVREYDFQVPYGVIQCEGSTVTGVQEKPVYSFFVNAGIYLLEPSVLEHIPGGRRSDMTDLIKYLVEQGRRVVSFPVVEYWLDIGRHADYEQAQQDIKSGKFGAK